MSRVAERDLAGGRKGSEWVCQVTQQRNAAWPGVGIPAEQQQQHLRVPTLGPSLDLQNQKPQGVGPAVCFKKPPGDPDARPRLDMFLYYPQSTVPECQVCTGLLALCLMLLYFIYSS